MEINKPFLTNDNAAYQPVLLGAKPYPDTKRYIVLCQIEKSNRTEYVVWFYHPDINSTTSGRYFREYEEALNHFYEV